MTLMFPGIVAPSTPFQPVRDGRRSTIRHYDIDLSTARSIAAGTQLVLPLAGNLIYFDQRLSGTATMYVQDDDVGSCGLTVFAGWKARVPFTALSFENSAQPGATLRLIYGVDLDLDPGIGAGVSVLNAVNVQDLIAPTCQYATAIVTPPPGSFSETVLVSAASNASGALVRAFTIQAAAGAGGIVNAALIASGGATWTSFSSAATAVMLGRIVNGTTTFEAFNAPDLARRIPAGWRIAIAQSNTVAAPSIVCDLSVELL